jgi:hypothetical protein
MKVLSELSLTTVMAYLPDDAFAASIACSLLGNFSYIFRSPGWGGVGVLCGLTPAYVRLSHRHVHIKVRD